MSGRRLDGIFVITTTAVLAVIAGAVLLFGGTGRGPAYERAGRAFQRTVCGLGIGSSLRADWGFANYDPRVDDADESGLWPVPGGYSYSPEQGMMGDNAPKGRSAAKSL